MGVPEQMPVRLRAVAARDRDVELGVAPHPVLVHVQPLRLDGRLDADAPDPVQHPEAAERGREHEPAGGGDATYAKKPTPPRFTDSVEPGLKPNQPNHRISVPSTA